YQTKTHRKTTVFRRNKNTFAPVVMKIQLKKTRNMVDEKTREKINRTFERMTKNSIENPATTYTSFLGEKVTGDSTKLRLKKSTMLVNRKKNCDINEIVQEMLNKMRASLDSEHRFTIKSGFFTVDRNFDAGKEFGSGQDAIPIDSLHTLAVKKTMNNIARQALFKDAEGNLNISFNGTIDTNIPTEFITNTADYTYDIIDFTSLDDEFVYVISFAPNKGLFGGNKGKYKGTLYVSADTYAVIREEFAMLEDEHGKKMNMKWLLGIKYVQKDKSGVIIFQKYEDAVYRPKYIQLNGEQYGYFNRDFVFKENDVPRRERIKMKMKALIEFNSNYQDEWLFTNSRPISEADYEEFSENKYILTQELDHYDPEVWERYNPLAPT